MKPIFVILVSLFLLSQPVISTHAATGKIDIETIKKDVRDIFQKMSPLNEGKNADYIPALDESHVDPKQFGIAIATSDGTLFSVGDSKTTFSIQSIAKPFVYALALRELPYDKVVETVGLN